MRCVGWGPAYVCWAPRHLPPPRCCSFRPGNKAIRCHEDSHLWLPASLLPCTQPAALAKIVTRARPPSLLQYPPSIPARRPRPPSSEDQSLLSWASSTPSLPGSCLPAQGLLLLEKGPFWTVSFTAPLSLFGGRLAPSLAGGGNTLGSDQG